MGGQQGGHGGGGGHGRPSQFETGLASESQLWISRMLSSYFSSLLGTLKRDSFHLRTSASTCTVLRLHSFGNGIKGKGSSNKETLRRAAKTFRETRERAVPGARSDLGAPLQAVSLQLSAAKGRYAVQLT